MPPETVSSANNWTEYANVFIPLGISLVGIIVSHYVYKEKVRHLEEAVAEVKKDGKEVRDKVIACETSLKEREPLTKKKSPVSLTERGSAFLKNSGGEKFVDDNFTELLNKVEAREPKTSFDVQEISKEIIASLQEDERLNPLKEFLFKDGSPLEDLVTVMGVYLRDKILTHKKWEAKDIDADPRAKD
jgi:hypothetical protein